MPSTLSETTDFQFDFNAMSLEPTWTPIAPQIPTLRALPAIPSGWNPCSPPLRPVPQSQREPSRWTPCSPRHAPELMHAVPRLPLGHFQYPDPQSCLASQPVPYLSLPPPSISARSGVSPMSLASHQTGSPTDVTSAPRSSLKRRRSIHLEDLYTSSQESASYKNDSGLSSAPHSPSTSDFRSWSSSGVKKGPKHRLEQTKERQAFNERRRAFYYRAKQDPAWKARQNALERHKYHKRQAAKLDLPAEATQAISPMKVIPETASTTPKTAKATKKSKPRWKGWMELSVEENLSEQDNETSIPEAKKGRLTKEIEDTKDFGRARAQGEVMDSDDDGRETPFRRSRRAKQLVSYADE